MMHIAGSTVCAIISWLGLSGGTLSSKPKIRKHMHCVRIVPQSE